MPDAQDTILLCEPQCEGFMHSRYNAALIETVSLARPGAQILFLGERAHVAAVQDELTCAESKHMERVSWHETTLPGGDDSLHRRLRGEFAGLAALFDLAADRGARLVILCSVSDSGLLALKTTIALRRIKRPTIVIPHGTLSALAGSQSERYWRRLTSFRQVLRLPHPKTLHYIALSESIHGFVVQFMPKAARHFSPLDLCYFWDAHETRPVENPKPVRFGYFGVNGKNKGFDTFHQLAVETRQAVSDTEFVMVGFVRSPDECTKYQEAIASVGAQPLHRDEFASRAASITYAVWTGNPGHYRLTASASFLDVLSHVKPGVYLRNPYIEHYFDKMGDIGYLCDSRDEMRDLLRSLATEFPAERYARQCEHIIRGRSVFEPATLAPKLRTIMDTCEQSVSSQIGAPTGQA
jgi:hypothetical protein